MSRHIEKNDVYFDNLRDVVISELKKAKKSVRVAVAWVSFQTYSEVFVELLKKKIRLIIIVSDSNSNRKNYDTINNLIDCGAKIKFLKMPNGYNHMHHKFCIIDKRTVITGSYNWTDNANKNYENIVVIRDSNYIADKFLEEFKALKEASTDTVKILQNLKRCKEENCKGKKFNLLLLNSNNDEYCTMNSQLIRVCSEEPSEHSKVIHQDIITDSTHLILSDLIEKYDIDIDELFDEGISIEEKEQVKSTLNKKLEFEISKVLSRIKEENENFTPIHAVGLMCSEPFGYDGDSISYIKVYWRDKFASFYISEEYYDVVE